MRSNKLNSSNRFSLNLTNSKLNISHSTINNKTLITTMDSNNLHLLSSNSINNHRRRCMLKLNSPNCKAKCLIISLINSISSLLISRIIKGLEKLSNSFNQEVMQHHHIRVVQIISLLIFNPELVTKETKWATEKKLNKPGFAIEQVNTISMLITLW